MYSTILALKLSKCLELLFWSISLFDISIIPIHNISSSALSLFPIEYVLWNSDGQTTTIQVCSSLLLFCHIIHSTAWSSCANISSRIPEIFCRACNTPINHRLKEDPVLRQIRLISLKRLQYDFKMLHTKAESDLWFNHPLWYLNFGVDSWKTFKTEIVSPTNYYG